MTQDQQPVAHTSHTEITLDQLGNMQPGLARLMAEVSDRYWILYYAAKGGNWKLAALQSVELEKALRIGEVTRPRYTAHLEAFIKGPLTAINKPLRTETGTPLSMATRLASPQPTPITVNTTTRRFSGSCRTSLPSTSGSLQARPEACGNTFVC